MLSFLAVSYSVSSLSPAWLCCNSLGCHFLSLSNTQIHTRVYLHISVTLPLISLRESFLIYHFQLSWARSALYFFLYRVLSHRCSFVLAALSTFSFFLYLPYQGTLQVTASHFDCCSRLLAFIIHFLLPRVKVKHAFLMTSPAWHMNTLWRRSQ